MILYAETQTKSANRFIAGKRRKKKTGVRREREAGNKNQEIKQAENGSVGQGRCLRSWN